MHCARVLLVLPAAAVACSRPATTGPPSARPAASRPAIEVAITVDDLPRHGPALPGQSRVAIHRAFLAAFRAHHLPPVYGFVCGGSIDAHPEDRAALEAWSSEGNPLGNHTRTHPDLHQTTVDAYLADLDANEPLLRTLANGAEERTWKVFRYPFLQEGTDLDSRARLRQQIVARGYRIAQVTIDFYDWAYNEPYARCQAKHDERAVAALKTSYLDHAKVELHWADAFARAAFGRPIPQILLLHIGAFDAVVFDGLLSLYEKEGVRFVSLDHAMSDPVYAQEPSRPTAWEGTFLSQLAESRATEGPPEPILPEALLDAMCR
jgi:peptidoglycan/xylan/chitin deacetylase (PgdA/CDA1 family)